jgi:ABC-2 type transport system permease protein
MIQGWTLPELALIYGIMHMGFASAEASARGFDTFSNLVKNGEFDRVLLRPCGTILQVAARDFQLMRIGRFLQGFVVLMWSCWTLGIPLISLKGLIILMGVIGTTSLFYALFVMQATLSFWTIETLEVMNITTYGGVETGQYPISIYNTGFRLFFTFIIPVACVAYYPMAVLLQHQELPLWVGTIFPLAGIAFLCLACQLWKLGVRHYHSAGS